MSHKTIIALTTAVALGCVPFATNAFAAGHPAGGHSGGHATGGHAMGGHPGYARGGHGGQYGGGYYGNGPVYDTCDGYNGCPGYGVPFVGGLINGALWAAIDDNQRTTDQPFLTGGTAGNPYDQNLETDGRIDKPVGKSERDRWFEGHGARQ